MSLHITDKQRWRVVSTAAQAIKTRISGKSKVTIGYTYGEHPQTFDLNAGGYCCRFVRQCHEVALGIGPFEWLFAGKDANATIRKLLNSDLDLIPGVPLVPGDIIGWQSTSGPGHIAIYVGDIYGDGRKLIAENTSAARGYPKPPGTKYTQLKNVRPRTHAFRLTA